MTQILGHGVYSVTQAARLLHLKPNRVGEWFSGRRTAPVFNGDYPVIEGDRAISFLDMIDALVAAKFREEGVSLQTLRRVYRRLENDFKSPHPFCRKELLTDGNTVFIRVFDEEGEEHLVEVLTRQKVFPRIILPYLKQLDYDVATSLAVRWNVGHGILVDPEICMGKPIVKEVGIATHILAREYESNRRNARAVANWYGIEPKHVLSAYRFERGLVA